MRKHTILSKAASIAVCFGILLTNTASAFDGAAVGTARDIELSAENTLRGQVYTSDGRPVEHAVIELRYQGSTVAKAMTGAEGDFLITGVRGGAHDLSVGSLNAPVRLWKNGTAPAGAADGILVAANENVVRGQAMDPYCDPNAACPPTSSGFGLIDVVTLAMLGTSVAAQVVAIDTNNDIDDLASP
jgi:hypothetical protein